MVDYSKVQPTPDAIPTIYGWAIPSTGEVLVSIRGGCESPVVDFYPNRPWTGSILKPEVIETIITPVEIVTEPAIESIVDAVIELPLTEEIIAEPEVAPKPEGFKLPKTIKSNVKS